MSMARHRTLHTRVQRGIAHWPVLVIAAVALLLLGWLGYTWVLGVPESAEQALLAGNGFTWSDLPGLAAAPDGWSRYGKPEWGRFIVAVPDPAGNPASALAIQSALAGTTAQGTGPVTAPRLAE